MVSFPTGNEINFGIEADEWDTITNIEKISCTNFGIETDEWTAMPDIEKRSCINRLQNYNVLKALGFKPTMPDFVKPKLTSKCSKKIVTQAKKPIQVNGSKVISSNEISCKDIIRSPKELQTLGKRIKSEVKSRPLSELSVIKDEQQPDMDEKQLLIFSKEEITMAIQKYHVFETVLNLCFPFLGKKKATNIQKTKELLNNKETIKVEDEAPETSGLKKKEVFNNNIDKLLFCDICDNVWEGACPHHGALFYVGDKLFNDGDPDHPISTTPFPLKVVVCESGIGVWTCCTIPSMVLFGPYTGEMTSRPDDYGYSWQVMKNDKVSHFISGLNIHASNWMRFVSIAQFENEINVLAFQYDSNIYYRTIKNIPPNSELKVWYIDKRCPELGLVPDILVSSASTKTNSLKLVICTFCKSTFHSELFLKTHIKYNHTEIEKNLCVENKTDEMDGIGKKICENNTQIGKQSDSTSEKQEDYSDVTQIEDTKNSLKIETNNLVVKNKKGTLLENINDSDSEEGCFVKGMQNLLEMKFSANNTDSQTIDIPDNILTNLLNIESTGTSQNTDSKRSFENEWKSIPEANFIMYNCKKCEFVANSVHELREHSSIEHSGVKFFTCTLCQQKFEEINTFTVHMQSHADKDLCFCAHCEYKTDSLSNMRKHMKRHSGAKLFKCDYCQLSFNDSRHLKRHFNKHGSDKPFACIFCNFCSETLESLKRHIKIHTEEKPFACPHCSYRCNQQSNLNVHIITHNKNKNKKTN